MRKRIFLLIGFVLPIFLIAQEEEDKSYMMWETMYITPDYTQLSAFNKAMAHHNKTYHNTAPYRAVVFNVTSSPNLGKMIWAMGPCMYSDLDNRPSAGGHDEDWANNVMPLIKKMNHGEYWRLDTDLSNLGGGGSPYKILRLRFHEVARGEGYRMNALLKKISDTVKSMEGDNPWAVVYNDWQQGYTIGRHVATVSYHNSWAELDDDQSFQNAYQKLHGEGSWTPFIKDIQSIFTNSWDEFWVYMPELSADFTKD